METVMESNVAHPAPRPAIPAGLVSCGVAAVARRVTAETAPAVADALVEGGVLAFEVTLNEPVVGAIRAIESVAARAPGLAIGAGTVLSIQAAQFAIDAGAAFLVMPHTDPELIGWAAERGIPTLPGAFTPTEILAGWRAGAAAVKLFPASVAGPAFVRECLGPFPDIPLVPSGGVTVQSAGDFIRAGAVAVGVGGWLIGDAAPAGVTARARQIVGAVAEARADLSR
ncbi:MAG: 2-dehydro-3-deoxyphosphogluconate aldolase / (4S)-4-hydroxy-2-oxoglutarate aldolase [Chloroflexota bacterium]|nr:2-dehydro-3-deoxyphosphogluconate aldolase / (4S)-4-hydroxy-2-oxoglutarate aldolase [Chloroflexota bacterium]